MKNNKLFNKLGDKYSRLKLGTKKHSPEILLAMGIIGGIGTVVVACKSTIKAKEVVDESKTKITDIQSVMDEATEKLPDDVKEEEIETVTYDYKKEKATVYIQAGVKIIKIYLPTFALGTLSLVSVLASHNIINKRNVALSAACTAITQDFKKYRNNVVERYGETIDQELRHNSKKEKIEKVVVDEESGKEKKVKESVNVVDNFNDGMYVYTFRKGNPNWSDNMCYNKQFLLAQEQYANAVLKSRFKPGKPGKPDRPGYFFENEFCDFCGFEQNRRAQETGWKYDPSDPNCDNEIKFRMYEAYEEDEFGNKEPVIRMDLNVDGSILDDVLK